MALYRFRNQALRRKIRTDTTRTERPDGRGWSETYTPVYQDVTGDLEIEVDWPGLVQLLGVRAMHNKSGKASLQEGLIKCSFKEKGGKK
jgi:hypothetical protein